MHEHRAERGCQWLQLPTRLISAAPPRVLDLSTSLWRLLSVDVLVRGRRWEDPSRPLRNQRLFDVVRTIVVLFCAQLRLLFAFPCTGPTAPFSAVPSGALDRNSSHRAASPFRMHRHYRAAWSCSSGTLRALHMT